MDDVRLDCLHGRAILEHLDALALLRITVFREFPYLYDGTMDYERRYLATYAAHADALLVLARAGDTVIGASTGLPLAAEPAGLQQPFVEAGLPVERFFYCGESALLAPWRGRGLGARFFEAREARAAVLGLDHVCFCAVQRPLTHPRRPPAYRPLDAFWQRRGYVRRPDLRTTMQWQDLDERTESPKPMVFWLRGPQPVVA